MSGSTRHKEKHGLRSVISLETRNEGTAARTRPFSFDEIMLRRKSRKVCGYDEDMIVDEVDISVKEIEKASNSSVSGRGSRNKNDFWPVTNHASKDFVKVSSRKKEDNTNMTGGILANKRDRDNRNSETKRRTSEDFVKVSSRKKEDKTAATGDRLVNKRYNDNSDSKIKSRVTLNKELRNKTKGNKDDRWDHGTKKNDEWSIGHSENWHAGNLGRKDRYEESREKSEKESRDKRRVEDNERIRARNAVKSNDSGRWDDQETSKRRERKATSHLHNVESRQKKRRSRSREHDKDRDRRSNSLSPRGHKRKSYSAREQGELSSHSSKDKSKRQQFEDVMHRLPSNGTNGHYKRQGEPASQLGGYSPRKRKTESAVKTPSPPHSHLEKKGATWDLPPSGADSNLPVSVNVDASNQIAASNRIQISTVDPVFFKTVKALSGVLSNASLDSIQLTQATRPMRRIYVENLTVSASEKDVMEYLNNFLLSSGVTHVQGSDPCISCSLHKEKGQALVEFLTPEYASAALSLNGRSFFGSILKIRRPKDFVEVATGGPDKLVAAVDSISDVVMDSPHKIFIGGISKAITPEMLKEIISAFGTLKAYHFEVNVDCSDPRAFLEYVDQSVTLKACAGLNGMRLGGQVLAAVLATPNAELSVENTGSSPFYGIPEHAKPLLEKPTQVLKIKNLLDPDSLSSLSEAEMEEILEDTRLECTRFGTVKAINVVKCSENPNYSVEGKYLNCNDKKTTTVTSGERIDCESEEISRSELQNSGKEAVEVNTFVEKLPDDIMEDELRNPSQIDESNDENECCDDKVDDSVKTVGVEMGNETADGEKLESVREMQEAIAETNVSKKIYSQSSEKDENVDRAFVLEDAFESGCVVVEYKREESACVAAHVLHRRIFDNRIVTVGYVDYDIYKAKFPK